MAPENVPIYVGLEFQMRPQFVQKDGGSLFFRCAFDEKCSSEWTAHGVQILLGSVGGSAGLMPSWRSTLARVVSDPLNGFALILVHQGDARDVAYAVNDADEVGFEMVQQLRTVGGD